MREETRTLQSEVNDLTMEIIAAQQELRRLISRRASIAPRMLLLIVPFAALLAITSWNLSAQNKSALYVVRAPFTVIDNKGKTLFRVEDTRKTYIGDAAGQSVVYVSNFGGGQIRTGSRNVSAAMHASAVGLGVSIYSQNFQVAFLGEGRNTEKTHGVAQVFSFRGTKAVAALTYTDHRGVAAVYHLSGKPIAMLTESDKIVGAGRVKISSSSVDGVFAAGGTGEGGDACAKRGAALTCLRPGLPLSIVVPNKP